MLLADSDCNRDAFRIAGLESGITLYRSEEIP